MLFYSGSDSRDGGRSELRLWRDGANRLEQVASISLRSPSWVVPHPRLPLLYATQETEPGEVVVLAVASNGAMRERQRVASQGSAPCHLEIDAAGTRLIVSNYQDGTVAQWSLGSDGTLAQPAKVWQLTGSGSVAHRQERAHAHMARLCEDGTILVADLGADALVALASDGSAEVVLSLPAGFGPRHFVSVGSDRLVLVGELSAELALIELGARPRVLDVVPSGRSSGALPSGIVAHRTGVVVANRFSATIAAFTIDGDRLAPVEEIRLPGDEPRAISSHGTRLFVCLQDAGLIATYTAGGNDGPQLTPAPHVSDFGALPWPVAAGL